MERRRAFSTANCKDNGRFDVMEERMHSGSFRQKSKVPRARFSSRADCVDYSSYELRNGAVKNSSLPRDCFSQGVSASSALEETFDTDEHKEWLNLIGERVCISGVKQGILRYYGRTNFAQGYWCGVELDESVGKNNGTVNGVVYFRCKPNHGIFAPISKVSKLNDLSGSSWRTEAKRSNNFSKQYSPPRSDYNVIPDAALLERKFIKNSISDPTFLRVTMKANLPRASESFPYDKRSYTEQRDRGAFRAKDIMNFEVPDASLARGSTSNGSTANATRNYQSASVLSKYGYGKKNQFFSSNVVTLGENNEIRDMFVSSKSGSDVPNRSAMASGLQRSSGFVSAEEEYEIFHQTPTNSGRVSPLPPEAKRYNDMPFYDYKMSDEILKAFKSHDFPDPVDDIDNDDQMSVDFDDSLGILTPSQMKDFTLCPDLPTSCSDIRGVDFPSSESFDDINDLPEDEQVHDVSVHYLPDSNSSTRTLEVTKQSSSCYVKGLTTVSVDDAKIEGLVSTTDEFLFSISQKDRQDMNSSKSDISIHSQVSSRKILESTRKMSTNLTNINEKSDISFVQFSKLAEHHNKTNQNISENHNLSDNNKMKMIAMKNFEEDAGRKNYDTDGSRDSLLQADSESNTALKEKLTVSWEDCISHNNDCMFTPVERPESVYTVASSDTGYQEDGELEAETGMTTSLDSTDGNKRFSTTSKDSCIVADDVDVYKIAESNSTSGYSTGLSDSCCNDRQEDDISGKPMTDEEIQDSVGPCDSEDGFSFQENNSISKDGDMGNAEGSDVTAETVTVLCHDSTSEALCETMVEDATLTEIHDLLLSPEENKSQSTNDDKENFPSAPDLTPAASVETSSVKTSEKTESSVSATTSTNSTPEKKMNHLNRNKTDVQRNSRMSIQTNKVTKTPRICDEDNDKKKVIAKSPKKNVMSKIKAMIEATSCKTMNKSKPENNEPVQKRVISAPKKSRWEAVTSKIAASLAEEKTKPKAKREIKSRVDTNLALARQQITTCRSPKLESVHHPGRGDGSMSPVSVCSRGRRPLIERNSAPSSVKDGRVSTTKEAKHGPKSPRPGKACITSRSTSPVAASESSTTSVSAASHNSRSKIALWKGSSSTIASSAPPTAVKKLATAPPSNKQPLPNTRLSSARMVSKKPPTAAKTRTHLTVNNNVHGRAVSPSVVSPRNERSTRISKPAKEQTGPRGGLHPATKPSRPPMWLSKAELTQEIQRLGNLCEARTKELNRLKMETKHVTVGFDAFAALFKYMVEDLNALSVPKLSADLEKTLKQVELTKQDLAYYEREVEEMKAHHCQELNDLSNKLFEVYQGEVAELNAKHNEEINHLKNNQQKQIESLSATFDISTEELKAQHEKLVARLEQEIICQQEEMKIFQEREIKDLEEKHAQSTKLLQEHIEQLQKKCAELKQHSLSMEDAMRKDTDSKLQWVTTRKVDLEKEVESLKAVLEMKNKELHSLRVQNLEMEKQLEELPLAREKIKMLQARAEDLEALMIEKTKLERKLSSENQQIRDTYEKESKVNKRLSMENEELQWRLRQAEQSLISGSFSEAAEYQEITENGTLSPVKSPAPQTLSRSVFFTFMDKDDISSYSPRSQYKKITSNFSANYKTSPGRTPKSPTTSPRRPKSHSEPPQPQLSSSTPRKIAKQPSVKHKTSQKRQRAGGDGGSTNNEQNEVNLSSMAESMASSVSSESSVFEHKERLLEEHKDHIMASLEILREQRSAEIAMSEPVTPTSTECMEVKGSPGFETQDMSRSAEFADPKTYYHMTFPVLKEGGIADCDTEDSGKVSNNSSSPSRDATDMHSMSVGNSPSKAGKTTSLEMNLKVMSTSSPEFGATDNSTEIQECISGAISADDVQTTESDKLSKAQGWRTL